MADYGGCTASQWSILHAAFNSSSEAQALCQSFATVDYTDTGLAGGLNTLYSLVTGAMVFLMHAGFAMLCAGAIRSKNAMNILLQTILDAAWSAIMYYCVGFGFAFGEGPNPNGFIGNSCFALARFITRYGENVYGSEAAWQQWLFQWAFAATATTIPAGAVAERLNFWAYLGYTTLISGFIYPVISHWIWSRQGWLAYGRIHPHLFRSGMIDFAGSGVVHMTGGCAALMGCIFVGPRMGRFDSNGKPVDMPGHSAVLVILGTMLLWFGWYGFNPGSVLYINTTVDGIVCGRTAVTTTLTGSACSVMCLITGYIRFRTWDLVAACNGALTGFVAITAGCHVLEPWAAVIEGITVSWFFDFMCWLFLKLRIDDPLSAAPMHMFGGMFGVLFVGFLAKEEYVMQSYVRTSQYWYGCFYPGGGGRLLACQVIGVLCIIAFDCGLSGIFFFIMKMCKLIRISPEEEQAGLDMSKHGGSAYNFVQGVSKPAEKGTNGLA